MVSEMKALAAKMEMACKDESQEEDDEMNMNDSEVPEGDASDKKKMFVAMMKKKGME